MALSVSNPWVFAGRRNRGTYFLWALTLTALTGFFVTEILPGLAARQLFVGPTNQAILSLPLVWLALSTTSQRLRDLDWSSWWCLMILIPGLGQFIALLLCVIPGTATTNRYQEPSLYSDS